MTWVSAMMIALIVFIHLPVVDAGWYGAWRKWGVDGICRLGVPWFFFASGVYFARHIGECDGWYGREIRKRVSSLLVPYFVLNLIWFPCVVTMNWIGTKCFNYPANVTLSLEWIVRGVGLSPVNMPIVIPLWFLRALFVVVVVGGLVWKFLRRNVWSGLAVAVACWGLYVVRLTWCPQDGQFFYYGLNVQGLALFMSGVCLSPLLIAKTKSPGISGLRNAVWAIFVLHAPIISLMLIPFKVCGGQKAFANPFCYFSCWLGVLVLSLVLGRVLRVDRLRKLV